MVKEVLVADQLTDEMVHGGAVLVAALDKAHFSVKAAFWFLNPDPRVWRLVIVVPGIREEGPLAVYRRLRAITRKLPDDVAGIGTKDISLMDEKAPLYLALRAFMRTGPGIAGERLRRNVIHGRMIEDVYAYRIT